jgi:hypothetical protein
MYNQSPMSRPIGKLVVHHRSQAVAIGTLDRFFLMRCFGDVTPDDVRATLLGHEAIIADHPEGAGSIVAVDPATSFPSDEMRQAVVEVTRKTNAHTRAHVLIVLGDGFWASAVRGIMMTLSSLTAATHARKIVRLEEEGVDWAIEAIGESVPKYHQLLLASLGQLKAGVTVPPLSPKPAS